MDCGLGLATQVANDLPEPQVVTLSLFEGLAEGAVDELEGSAGLSSQAGSPFADRLSMLEQLFVAEVLSR